MRSNGGEKRRKEKFEDFFFFRVFRYNKVVYESFKGIIKAHVYTWTHKVMPWNEGTIWYKFVW